MAIRNFVADFMRDIRTAPQENPQSAFSNDSPLINHLTRKSKKLY